MTVDLETQRIERVGLEPICFSYIRSVRNKPLFGPCELDEMLEHSAQSIAFRIADRARRPWVCT